MVKTSNATLIALIAFVVGFILGAVAINRYRPCVNLPVVTVERDTVILRDTFRGDIPPPTTVTVLRVDTVRMELRAGNPNAVPVDTIPADTTRKASDAPRIGPDGTMLVPISKKVYETADYRAVVSGWRAALDSIDIYRKSTVITNTVTKVRRPWIAVAIGGGGGYGTDGKVRGYAGVMAGIVIWSR